MSMGIQKIGHGIAGVGSDHCRAPYVYNVDNMEMEENQASGTSLGDGSGDSELAELMCELGMVEGQVCNIPFELYDLPDLREILSLDTWNWCLTEEERFSLSSYLPDMDQENFWLTMKELLGGSDLFFGSPLDIFFNRLKGGFYPPNVTRFREGLHFLQRRKYYHLLRSYHENMAQTFMDMRKTWDHCEMSTGVEERVYLWTRKNRKVTDMLDLNTYPKDGFLLSKDAKPESIMPHLSRKTKSAKSKKENRLLIPLGADAEKSIAPTSRAKGVLKIKASISTFEKHNSKAALSRTLEAPRGVLKMVPKVPSVQPKQSKAMPRRLEPILLVKDLPHTHQWDAGGFCEAPFFHQKVDYREVRRTPKQPRIAKTQLEPEFLNITTGPSRHSESLVRKVKRGQNPLLDDILDSPERKLCGGDSGMWKGYERVPKGEHEASMDTKEIRYACSSENLRLSLGMENRELPVRSLEPHPSGVQYYEGDWHHEPVQESTIMHPGIPQFVSRIPNIGIEEQHRFMSSSDQMKVQIDVSVGDSEKLYRQPGVPDSFQNELALPLTYKRKKSRAKLNSTDFVKPVTVGAELESATRKESNHHIWESSQPVKIKFKSRKNYSLDKES